MKGTKTRGCSRVTGAKFPRFTYAGNAKNASKWLSVPRFPGFPAKKRECIILGDFRNVSKNHDKSGDGKQLHDIHGNPGNIGNIYDIDRYTDIGFDRISDVPANVPNVPHIGDSNNKNDSKRLDVEVS